MVIVKSCLIGVTVLVMCLITEAQTRRVTPTLQDDLNNKGWQVRRDAFERVAGIPNVTNDPLYRQLLIRLRNEEDVQAEKGEPDLFEDDNYLAYDEELTDLVEKIAVATNDRGAWRSLVNMRYNPDSETGHWLAKHRQTLPYIIEHSRSVSFVRRMNAVYLLALVLSAAKEDGSLVPRQYKYIKQIICRLAVNDVAPVQQFAIRGLGVIDDKEDIPLLERLSAVGNSPESRQFALDALAQIRKANAL